MLQDLSDRWAPAIIETEEESIVLEFGVSDQDKRLSHWIGGSTNRGAKKTMRMRHYIPDYTGINNKNYYQKLYGFCYLTQ